MGGTSLLGGPRITGDEVRQAHFPSQVLGGYRPADVEAFRARVCGELDMVHRALDDMHTEREEFLREIKRLTGLLGNRTTGPHPAAANGERAISILSVAQQHADQLVADAQEEARRVVTDARRDIGQMTEHARQQAADVLRQAAEEGTAEKARIIDSATAEARKQADFLAGLAGTMRAGLGGQVDELLKNLSEWEQMVHSGATAEPATARPSTG
jgi:DivIVA domain-containing protein